MKRIIPILTVIFVIVFMSACSEKAKPEKSNELEEKSTSEEKQGTDKGQEADEDNSDSGKDSEIEAAPLPKSLSEVAALSPGYTSYISILDEEGQKKIDELTKDLPNISDNPTENELNHFYNKLLAIFQQDYQGPEDLIARLKFSSIGSPDVEDPRMQFKDNLNVLVILDGSGSMAKDIGGQTQMAAAKKAIVQFVGSLPKETNVGLRVYGHKGTGSSADKEMSCSSSDLLYPFQPYDKAAFQKSLDQVQPAGWTPTELALTEAQKDLASYDGASNTNIVYLVSDGISTCDDDPVAAAKALYDSNITPIINVIGFNVDHDGQRQLKEVAKAVEGTYQDVQDAASLQKELDQAKDIAKKWAEWKESEAKSLSYERTKKGLEIFGYDAKEYKKVVDEGQQVGFALQYLYQTKKIMSRESHDYLRTRNSEYHDWIKSQQNALKEDLKKMNDMQYNEAIQALEDKYLQNTPD